MDNEMSCERCGKKRNCLTFVLSFFNCTGKVPGERLFANGTSWYLNRGNFLSRDHYGCTAQKGTKGAL
ncbi:hypothetical protein TNCV_1652051 [Trichonephila clavipes]|nr:hypothetical protein TNCV_1652051 [Trichonephila clavipes]